MSDTNKEVLTWAILIIGSLMLWGTLFIAWIDWKYNLIMFRSTLMGLALVGVGYYLRAKWKIK